MSSGKPSRGQKTTTGARASKPRALVVRRHHLLVRISHWLTIPLLLGLILSGMSIYWASPVYQHRPDPVSGSVDPLADIRWTIPQPDPLSLAGPKKLYDLPIHEPDLFQVESNVVVLRFATEKILQLQNVLFLDSTAENEHGSSFIFGSSNLQHFPHAEQAQFRFQIADSNRLNRTSRITKFVTSRNS